MILDIHQWGAHPLYQAFAVWHWVSGTGIIHSFIHYGWCLDFVLTTEATMRNCQNLCQRLSTRPRAGSLCLIEVAQGMALSEFRVLPCFRKLEIVDLISGEIDCEHKLVYWFV